MDSPVARSNKQTVTTVTLVYILNENKQISSVFKLFFLGVAEKFLDLVAPGNGVQISQIDKRAGEPRLEQ